MRKYIVTCLVNVLAVCSVGAAQISMTVDDATPGLEAVITDTVRASIEPGEACVAANQSLRFDNSKLELITQSAGNAGVFVSDSRDLAVINVASAR